MVSSTGLSALGARRDTGPGLAIDHPAAEPAATSAATASASSPAPAHHAVANSVGPFLPASPAAGTNPNNGPNQVDLGMSVVNLTIDDINDISSGDWSGPYYDLDVDFSTTDPITGSTVTDDTTVGRAQGCSGMASCGIFPFAFSSSETASLSFTLHDNQQGYGGCYCYVNINGNSATWGLSGFGGAQSPSFSLNGASCTATAGCGDSTSGNSGSRTAQVVFTITVETALLSEVAGRLSTYDAYNWFLNGLNSQTTSIICPSAGSLIDPDTQEMVIAAILAVFSIMTLGSGTATALAVGDVMSEVADLWDISTDYTLDQLAQYWGDYTASTYPSNVNSVAGLQSAAYTGAVACGNLENFWGDGGSGGGLFDGYYSSNVIYAVESDLSALITDAAATQTALLSGSLSKSVTAMQTEESESSQLQSDANTLDSDLTAFWGSGAYSSNCQEYQASCGPSAEFLYYNVIGPLSTVASDDYSLLAEDVGALQGLSGGLGLSSCNLPTYVEEGGYYSDTNLVPMAGIGPYYVNVNGASWLSASQIGADQFGVSGTAPSSYGTYTVSIAVQDNVGDSVTVCSTTVTVGFKATASASPSSLQVGASLGLSAAVTGGPGGTYSYAWYGLPTGCSSQNSASFTCYPSATGTWHPYVTATDSNSYSATSPTVSVGVTADADILFDESGLASGTSWTVTVAGSQSSSTSTQISVAEPSGTWAYSIGFICGYSVSPEWGNVTLGTTSYNVGIVFTSSPTYTLKFSESGAPSGDTWQVFIAGTCSASASTGSSISFTEPDGTYHYDVDDVGGTHILGHSYSYVPSPQTGKVTISGASATVSVTYTFTQINRPAHLAGASSGGSTIRSWVTPAALALGVVLPVVVRPRAARTVPRKAGRNKAGDRRT